MAIEVKIGGTWTTVARPYVKRTGLWAPVKAGYVKRAGSWQLAYIHDVTPPTPPELILSAVSKTDGSERYINVGVRDPDAFHDPNLALIRVLYGGSVGYPTSQFGGAYIGTPDNDYPTEPWSDTRYNGYAGGTHASTSVITRQYPPNKTAKVPGGARYYFTAWAMDLYGNWSEPTMASIFVPKATAGTDLTVVKHARFRPVGAGSVRAGTYLGEPPQTRADGTDALFFYGGYNVVALGTTRPTVTITNAQVLLYRKNDDGSPQANVFLFWHNQDWPGWTGGDIHDITYVGNIAKGEAKWFAIPAAMIPNIVNKTFKGLGVYYKNPAAAAATADQYMDLYSPNDETGSIVPGALDLVWTEDP